jgi:hypothetical protein
MKFAVLSLLLVPRKRVILTLVELDVRIFYNLPKSTLLAAYVFFTSPLSRHGRICSNLPSKTDLAVPKLLANLDSVYLSFITVEV